MNILESDGEGVGAIQEWTRLDVEGLASPEAGKVELGLICERNVACIVDIQFDRVRVVE